MDFAERCTKFAWHWNAATGRVPTVARIRKGASPEGPITVARVWAGVDYIERAPFPGEVGVARAPTERELQRIFSWLRLPPEHQQRFRGAIIEPAPAESPALVRVINTNGWYWYVWRAPWIVVRDRDPDTGAHRGIATRYPAIGYLDTGGDPTILTPDRKMRHPHIFDAHYEFGALLSRRICLGALRASYNALRYKGDHWGAATTVWSALGRYTDHGTDNREPRTTGDYAHEKRSKARVRDLERRITRAIALGPVDAGKKELAA